MRYFCQQMMYEKEKQIMQNKQPRASPSSSRRCITVVGVFILILANTWRITLNLQVQGYNDYLSLLPPSVTTTSKSSTFKDLSAAHPFAFSACLLIKDNNIILPEWLAYHYTVLPLRRLIVAVDTLSHTDPSPILDSYRSIGMNITVWKNESLYYPNNPYVVTDRTDGSTLKNRYNSIQSNFYTSCLQQLQKEGMTWTAVVDTDEYIAFNYYDELEDPPSFCRGNTTCEEEYLKSIKDGTNKRMKLDNASTVADIIHGHTDEQFHVPETPCIVISRYLFVAKESEEEEKMIELLPTEFNTSFFDTLRYPYRACLNCPQQGKSIVDVSRYDGRYIPNPHRLLGTLCTGGNSWAHNAAMSFRVHHYVGTWLSFRQPGVDLRGKDMFNARNNQKDIVFDNSTGYSRSTNTTWLERFIKLVGKEKALTLTVDARMHAEIEKLMVEVQL